MTAMVSVAYHYHISGDSQRVMRKRERNGETDKE
jgi:hypothetical protein